MTEGPVFERMRPIVSERPAALVPIVLECLGGVRQARFFETERGYQGELLAELRARLTRADLPGGAIVEQEYQKRLPEHGIKVRPDLIIHLPTPPGGNRRRGNFAVFELKLRAGKNQAREDFANLDAVLSALDYPLGVFVNIASNETHAAQYGGPFRARLHFFAVRRAAGQVQVRHSYYRQRSLREELHESV